MPSNALDKTCHPLRGLLFLASLDAWGRPSGTAANPMCRIFFAVVVVLVSWSAAAAPPDQSIAIETTGSEFVITVPVSRVVMTLPKGGLVMESKSIDGAAGHPRYFKFQESDRALILSGWFEPAHAFKGLDDTWASETAAWKKNGLSESTNVVFGEAGPWQTIAYEMDLPDITNSHIRAHLVQSGTWIDLHLSITSLDSPEENRKLLQAVLDSIIVKEKASPEQVLEPGGT